MESLKVFENDPLLFPPGTRFSYSGYGYVLISAVVEGASGEDFLSYMHKHVFEPLGMSHTVEDRVGVFMPNRAHFYDGTKHGRLVDCPYTDTSVVRAAGGFLSTGEDLVRFGSAYLSGSSLKPETVKLFFTLQTKIPVLPLGYGMGWLIGRDLRWRRFVGHTGGMPGGKAVLLLYTEERVVMAMCANAGNRNFSFMSQMGILQLFIAARAKNSDK